MHGDLVFGWRLGMKLQLLDAQVRLLAGAPDEALRIADELREDAVRAGVPRYDASARLVAHRARAALGEPVDLDQAWRDLGDVEGAVRVEAWWWAGETGAELGQPTLARPGRASWRARARAGGGAPRATHSAPRRTAGSRTGARSACAEREHRHHERWHPGHGRLCLAPEAGLARRATSAARKGAEVRHARSASRRGRPRVVHAGATSTSTTHRP